MSKSKLADLILQSKIVASEVKKEIRNQNKPPPKEEVEPEYDYIKYDTAVGENNILTIKPEKDKYAVITSLHVAVTAASNLALDVKDEGGEWRTIMAFRFPDAGSFSPVIPEQITRSSPQKRIVGLVLKEFYVGNTRYRVAKNTEVVRLRGATAGVTYAATITWREIP